ncbi:hypothetical protein [Streptomyces griseosporeus]|uniref:hypothetical protein n=1 Tax=Streptomyces griseosporeus TaxID=1910 RepID=UPI0036FEF3C4
MTVELTKPTGPTQVPLDQWAWWCHDNRAVQERGLGLANCLVCAQEPTEVIAWECGLTCPTEHAQRDVAHHVRFKNCEHQVDVIFSWEALGRVCP